MTVKEKKREYDKQWCLRNKEKRKAIYTRYNRANKDKMNAYRRLHKDKRNKKHKERRENDLNYKIKSNLRCRLRSAIKLGFKAGSCVKDLGCTIEQLKSHLESQFQSGMNWENWGIKGWHIDHIKPLSKFDLTDRKQFLEAVHYTNLQPLWANENLSKSDTFFTSE